MRTVWKYLLAPQESQTYGIPSGFIVRHVGENNGSIAMWIEVDTTASEWPVTFCIVGTGHQVPDGVTCCGTAVMSDGFVWHVYSVTGP